MDAKIRSAAEAVLRMEAQLQKEPKGQPWEETFICRRIQRRMQGGAFSTGDHIRAVVYSMLSSGISWKRVEELTDPETGAFLIIDAAFCGYDPAALLQCKPETLQAAILRNHCGSYGTKAQMEALLGENIPKLRRWETQYGSVDAYYQTILDKDPTGKALIKTLAEPGEDKLAQLGPALVCEYLKNAGYDLAKPDRHICRILGSNILGCSEKATVPPYEALTLVAAIAVAIGKGVAETDYILWRYCARGYGEICTGKAPKCDRCVVTESCKGRGNKS